jgi:hypothetical protein
MEHFFIKRCSIFLTSFLMLATSVGAEEDVNFVADYDENLCSLAQHFVLNADTDLFEMQVQIGEGNGFHTIQMDVDGPTNTVSIATTKATQMIKGIEQATFVSCKMVNRDRVNDVLSLNLPEPDRACGEVNAYTYDVALSSLSQLERARYVTAGKKLVLDQDYIAASGGEWLPSSADQYIANVAAENGTPSYINIKAPSVRVPWNSKTREFFQGTQHCKLISLATMRDWMTVGSLKNATRLFPETKPVCDAPSSMTSEVGSCYFYFAPANSMYCQDYSGADWDKAAAQVECSNRHATRAALAQANNKYGGAGGNFSDMSCQTRPEVEEIAGTCVFHCKAGDETLWHSLEVATGPGKAMMAKACDLFVE